MKRTILVAGGLVLASGLFAMPNALADHATSPEPSSACAGGPGDVITQPSPGSTSGSLSVCVTQGPVKGNATAGGSATGPSGYVVADGDSGNSGALAGYIGVEGDGSGVQAVSNGCKDPYEPGQGQPVDVSGLADFIGNGGSSDCDGNGHSQG